jgi:hypothetical protein
MVSPRRGGHHTGARAHRVRGASRVPADRGEAAVFATACDLHTRRSNLAGGMGTWAGIVATFAAAATARDDVGERARALLDGSGYQRTLPGPQPPPDATFHWNLDLARLLVWLAYAGAAILVILAVVWLARRFGPGTDDVEVKPKDEAARPRPVAIPTANAEALATAGRFGEAIHQLLLDTLGALSRAARLEASLTSREIVARVPLAPRAREALGGLVAAVEISFFGGEAPGEPEYRACRERFEVFLESYRRAA